jgi:RNA polymerase sigma-70 factor, ECF subfamily
MIATEEKLDERVAARRDAGGEVWAEADFERVFLAHYARVVAVLLRLVGDRMQAEELAGEVFWKIYRQPPAPGEGQNVGGWLYRAATRLGIDALRALKRRRRYEQEAGASAWESAEAGPQADPLSGVLREEKRRRVREVLTRLKPAQAQLLILRQSGLSYQELARALGVKPGSIGTLLARAEAEFEKRYRELHGDGEGGG